MFPVACIDADPLAPGAARGSCTTLRSAEKRPSGNVADEPQPMLDIDVNPTCTAPHMQALADIPKKKMGKAD